MVPSAAGKDVNLTIRGHTHRKKRISESEHAQITNDMPILNILGRGLTPLPQSTAANDVTRQIIHEKFVPLSEREVHVDGILVMDRPYIGLDIFSSTVHFGVNVHLHLDIRIA